MNKLIYKKGNLLDATEPVICHGVNCQGIMGAGVALAIKQKWYLVYVRYREMCSKNDPQDLLGRIQTIRFDLDGKYIVNMFTQLSIGGHKPVSYDAIDEAFHKLFDLMKHSNGYNKLAIPRIGAGLGGGDWNVIETIILSRKPDNIQVTVYDYEP